MFPINWPPMETCSALQTCSIPRNSKYQSCAKQGLALTVILDSADRLAVQKNAGAVTRDGGSGLVCRRHGPAVTDRSRSSETRDYPGSTGSWGGLSWLCKRSRRHITVGSQGSKLLVQFHQTRGHGDQLPGSRSRSWS